MSESAASALVTLRRRLLAVLLFGLLGTAAELLVTGHYEDAWQLVPVVVLAVATLATLALLVTRPTAVARATRLFRSAMVLLIVSGATGSVLHYRANMEFKREMDPSLGGFPLFASVIQAKAPPTLAPGSLFLLGLLGLTSVLGLGVQNSTQN